MKKWFKKNKFVLFIIFIGFLIVFFFGNFLFSIYILLNYNKNITYKNIIYILKQNKNNSIFYFNLFILIFYIIIIVFLGFFKFHFRNEFIAKTNSTIFGGADWLSKKELNENYPLVSLENPNFNYGVVANSFETKMNIFKVNIRNGTHTMVVAGTRSGKTQCVVIPTLQLLARSKTKCGVIISDPKGELFDSNSKIFEDNGYDVIKLDLRNPELSICWNPLSIVYENWLIGCKLEEMHNSSLENNNSETAKYYQFQQKAIDYILDICNTLFPVNDPKEKFWQETASSVLKGILLGILYDMRENKVFDENKFNLSSIIPLVNNKDQLLNYFSKLDIAHPARIAVSGLVDGAKETTGSILQSLKAGLEKFSDPILRTLISKSELKLANILNQPTAIFLVVPDERTDRHVFASLFISQSYKMLIELANFSETRKLEIPFYYILDEFANIPKISEMGPKISVSGSRNIWWLLIIQDKPQLVDKYGDNMARTINNNCSMHIFLQTMDLETAKYYSEIIGEKTIVTKTRSNKILNEFKDRSGTRSLNHVYLIKAADLMKLKSGEAIVIFSKEKPIRGNLLPMWKSNCYIKGKIKEKSNIPLTNEQFSKNYVYKLWGEEDKENNSNQFNFNNEENNSSLALLLEKEKIIKIEGKIIEIEEMLQKYEIKNEFLKQYLNEKINEIYELTG